MEAFSWEVIAEILGALFILSEALAKIPGIKANSVFDLVYGFLSKFKK